MYADKSLKKVAPNTHDSLLKWEPSKSFQNLLFVLLEKSLGTYSIWISLACTNIIDLCAVQNRWFCKVRKVKRMTKWGIERFFFVAKGMIHG